MHHQWLITVTCLHCKTKYEVYIPVIPCNATCTEPARCTECMMKGFLYPDSRCSHGYYSVECLRRPKKRTKKPSRKR